MLFHPTTINTERKRWHFLMQAIVLLIHFFDFIIIFYSHPYNQNLFSALIKTDISFTSILQVVVTIIC